MASALAMRMFIIYLFLVIFYFIFTGGLSNANNLLSAHNYLLIIGTIIGSIAFGAVTAYLLSGVFIGAVVVGPAVAIFASIFSAANPIGSTIFGISAGLPPGLAGMINIFGVLASAGTYALVGWALISMIAG